MSNESEIQQATSKGIEGVVRYCAICGIEFQESLASNSWLKCDACESVSMVRTKS